MGRGGGWGCYGGGLGVGGLWFGFFFLGPDKEIFFGGTSVIGVVNGALDVAL